MSGGADPGDDSPETSDPGPNEEFCTSCGATVHTDAVICPECGVERDRTRSGDGAFQERLMNLQSRGWEVEDRYDDGAVLVKRSVGAAGTHVLIALLTVWWTGGMGNAAYAAYKYFVDVDRQVVYRNASSTDRSISEEVFCRSCGESINASADVCPHCGVRAVHAGRASGADTVGGSVADADVGNSDRSPFQWVFGVLLTLAGVAALAEAGGAVALAGGLAMLLLGLYLIPAVRDRLRTAYPVTAFGRRKRVEESVLRGGDRPCSTCFDPVERGVEREYHDEFVLFGVPVYSYDSGTNEYCRDCAAGEIDDGATAADDLASENAPGVEYETE